MSNLKFKYSDGKSISLTDSQVKGSIDTLKQFLEVNISSKIAKKLLPKIWDLQDDIQKSESTN